MNPGSMELRNQCIKDQLNLGTNESRINGIEEPVNQGSKEFMSKKTKKIKNNETKKVLKTKLCILLSLTKELTKKLTNNRMKNLNQEKLNFFRNPGNIETHQKVFVTFFSQRNKETRIQ